MCYQDQCQGLNMAEWKITTSEVIVYTTVVEAEDPNEAYDKLGDAETIESYRYGWQVDKFEEL